MIFKELRPVICDTLEIIIGQMWMDDVDLSVFTHDYDYYEVIGVRSDIDYTLTFSGCEAKTKVVVSLKETLSEEVPFGNPYHKRRENKDTITCKE